jgi:hydroxyacylglutathione hydrolase
MKTWKTKNGHKIIKVLAGRSNVYLVSYGDKNILVDTSPGSRWKKLDRRLRGMGIERLDALILTHTHYDHAGNATRIQGKYRTKVIVHRFEAPFLEEGDGVIPEGTHALTRFLVKRLGRFFSRHVHYEPCRPDILVDEMLSLADCGVHARIIHTPGHSPGSMSVIVDDEIALVGDAMFGIFPWSVFPPFASDARQMAESWGKLLETGCRLFLPSHGTANGRKLVQKDYDKRKRSAGSGSPH